MSTSNRSALLAKVHKVLKKHYKPVVPAERSVLDHLLYACCLENARHEAADEAFARLQEMYVDWNEVRVTTVTELAETMSSLPDAAPAAQRLKKALQTVFETVYDWTLEHLLKQNIGKAEKDLEKIQGVSSFTVAYVVQNALGGHAVPVNRGALEVLHAVGVINDSEADKRQVPGMERAIPKNKGVEFGSLLHQIGADFFASPGSQKLRGILAEIDADYKERLTQRQARLEEQAQARAAAAEKERDRQRAALAAERAQAAADQRKEEQRKAAAKAAKAAKAARSGKGAKPAPQQPPPVKPPPPTPVEQKKPVIEPAKSKGKEGAEKPADKPPARPDKPLERAADKGGDKAKDKKPVPKETPKRAAPPDDKSAKKSPVKGLAKRKPR